MLTICFSCRSITQVPVITTSDRRLSSASWEWKW